MATKRARYRAVKTALDELFADTSVSRATTREDLLTLKDEIDTLLDALDDDSRQEKTRGKK